MDAKRKILMGAGIGALVIVAGADGWLLRGSDNAGATTDPGAAATAPAGPQVGVPVVVTPGELKAFAARHYPLYWAGRRPNTKIELTRTTKDITYVRYLPDRARAGAPGDYLTVGTYQGVDGYTPLSAATTSTAQVTHARSGAVIVAYDARPLSTYFSFENAGFQVEVHSPERGQSERLTDDGSIRPVGGAS